MSNFEFLSAEWKDLHEAATKAEQTAIPDPRTSCFYARRALELAVAWAYKFDWERTTGRLIMSEKQGSFSDRKTSAK